MFAVLLVGLYFVSIVGKKKPVNPAASPVPTQAGVGNENLTSESGSLVKNVEVVGSEFSYTPDALTFSKGDDIRLTFKNEGTVSHNLAIEGLGLTTRTIAPGSSDTIEFSVDKVGSYDFFCTVDSHQALGMKGTIEVK